MRVNDVSRAVLVDTGCSRCLVHVSCCGAWHRSDVSIVTMNGARHRCLGVSNVCIQIDGHSPKFVQAFVIDFRPLNVDFVLGMNGVIAFGGVFVGAEGRVELGSRQDEAIASAAHIPGGVNEWRENGNVERDAERSFRRGEKAASCGETEGEDSDQRVNAKNLAAGERSDIEIEEKDFKVTFDAEKKKWTAVWKWTDDQKPKALTNTVTEYAIKRRPGQSMRRKLVYGWREGG